MYFLVEQYRYPIEALKDVFGECLGEFNQDWLKTFAGDKISYIISDDRKYVKFDYVGYCYFSFKGRSGCIFFMPKVIMKGDDEADALEGEGNSIPSAKILSEYDPVEYIDSAKLKEENYEHYSFILKLSYEVCKAVRVYWERNKNKASLPQKQSISDISAHLNDRPQSLIDLLRALEQFAIDNQDWFLFMTQQSHNPQKKINWRKTIQNTQPVFQDNTPVYLNPITVKKEIDFDEELLTIFNSILLYINTEYGLHCPVNEGYDLIVSDMFDNYLQGYGHLKLSEIRYRYFSDKTLELWNLCDEFFMHHNASEKVLKKEYILAKGFHNVFEKMMDHLIGADNDKKLESQKKLNDGKVIDHLYKDYSLVNPKQEIIYIADSKYYTIGAEIGEESRWKQFTYASDIQNERSKEDWVFDRFTNGYDVIPNYLISAALPKDNITDFDYEKITENPIKSEDNHMTHVDNALFSATSKYIFRFDINFLYAISLYARDDDSEINGFKNRVHAEVRSKIMAEYDEAFRFFWISEDNLPKNTDVRDILVMDMHNGGYLPNIGKVFSFDNNGKRIFVFALQRDTTETIAIISILEQNGYLHKKEDSKYGEEYLLSEDKPGVAVDANRERGAFTRFFGVEYTSPDAIHWNEAEKFDMPLTEEELAIFTRSYGPDFDCRFFPTFFDGHYYILRSGFWEIRFDYIKKEDGLYHIENLVMADHCTTFYKDILADVFCDGYYTPRMQENEDYRSRFREAISRR